MARKNFSLKHTEPLLLLKMPEKFSYLNPSSAKNTRKFTFWKILNREFHTTRLRQPAYYMSQNLTPSMCHLKKYNTLSIRLNMLIVFTFVNEEYLSCNGLSSFFIKLNIF